MLNLIENTSIHLTPRCPIDNVGDNAEDNLGEQRGVNLQRGVKFGQNQTASEKKTGNRFAEIPKNMPYRQTPMRQISADLIQALPLADNASKHYEN